MKIKLLAVGKLKNPLYFQAMQNYLIRLRPYVQVRIEEVSDFPLRKGMQPKIAQDQEGEALKERLKEDAFFVVLDVEGKQKSSEDFSALIGKWEGMSVKEVTFIIGGAYGVSEEIRRNARERLSLSKMTFPHELARLIFVEQLYRAYTILKGLPYHHAG